MDFYHYYFRRLDTITNKKIALDSVKSMAIKLLDESPVQWGIESAANLLAVLHDWKNPAHLELGPVFNEIQLAMDAAVYCLKTDVELDDQFMMEPPEPEEPEEPEPPEEVPAPATMEPPAKPEAENWMYMPPYAMRPDWETWEHWAEADWEWFRNGYWKKVLAAAKAGLTSLRLPLDTLSAIKANIQRLPLERKVQVAMLASDLVDTIYETLEGSLLEIHKDSINTPAGRLVQKQLLSVTSGGPEKAPD